jgi:hypothetical protein
MECLNGCFDLDYGEDESALLSRVCHCTPAETLAGVERWNARGYTVAFQPREKGR